MESASVLPKGPQGVQAVRDGAPGQPRLTCPPSLISRRLGEVDGPGKAAGQGWASPGPWTAQQSSADPVLEWHLDVPGAFSGVGRSWPGTRGRRTGVGVGGGGEKGGLESEDWPRSSSFTCLPCTGWTGPETSQSLSFSICQMGLPVSLQQGRLLPAESHQAVVRNKPATRNLEKFSENHKGSRAACEGPGQGAGKLATHMTGGPSTGELGLASVQLLETPIPEQHRLGRGHHS